MKTLRLTRAESAAYTNGERRFWRACNSSMSKVCKLTEMEKRQLRMFCPYGKPGDLVKLSGGEVVEGVFMITAITVEQRGGRWGWLLEVGQ
jgi:hypothetical protein